MSNFYSGTASKLQTPNGWKIYDNPSNTDQLALQYLSATNPDGDIPGFKANAPSGGTYYDMHFSNWYVRGNNGSIFSDFTYAVLEFANTGLISNIYGVPTAGLGLPAIYGENTITAQTTSGTTIATYTPSSAGNFEISAEYLITAITSGGAEIQVSWTDEGGTARTATLLLASLSGTTGTGATTTGPFSAIPYRLRSQANSPIAVMTAGTFTATYDASAAIKQTG